MYICKDFLLSQSFMIWKLTFWAILTFIGWGINGVCVPEKGVGQLVNVIFVDYSFLTALKH